MAFVRPAAQAGRAGLRETGQLLRSGPRLVTCPQEARQAPLRLLPRSAPQLLCSRRRFAGSRWLSPSVAPHAELSERRMKEFLDAEVTHFAAMHTKSLTLEDLLRASASQRDAAIKVHQEIPKHFAARIRQIESLNGWSEDARLVDLHTRYSHSFQEMRMVEVGDDLAPFTAVVRRLKERQRAALPLIGQVLQRRQGLDGYSQEFWRDWLGRFLRSRIATEMLTSQYAAIVSQVEKGSDVITGIMDPHCDPVQILERAVECARQLCLSHMGVDPVVDVEVRAKRTHEFSYIPLYLHYILLELLKNSFNATARAVLASHSCMDPVNEKLIHVVICSDDHRVAIRISDLAGGIPFEVGDRVWDFGFSGERHDEDGRSDPLTATPLAGYGLGLPLARLYAQYLGGSLSLVSLPDYGVDSYLFLPRIDIAPLLAGNGA